MLVPRMLVAGTDTGASVWVADALNGVARRQSVQIGRAGTDQLVEVTQGLDPTVKLIVAGRESLSDGADQSCWGGPIFQHVVSCHCGKTYQLSDRAGRGQRGSITIRES